MSPTQHGRFERLGPSNELAGAPEHGWFGTPPPIRVDALQVLVRPVVEGRAPPPGIEQCLSDDERTRGARFVSRIDSFPVFNTPRASDATWRLHRSVFVTLPEVPLVFFL